MGLLNNLNDQLATQQYSSKESHSQAEALMTQNDETTQQDGYRKQSGQSGQHEQLGQLGQHFSILGSAFNIGSSLGNHKEPHNEQGPDLSILSKIKSRLMKGAMGEKEEAKIDQHEIALAETQKIDNNSTIRDNAHNGTDQQDNDDVLNDGVFTKFQVLPQLEVDETEYLQPSSIVDTNPNLDPTQVIPKTSKSPNLQNLFISDDEIEKEVNNDTEMLSTEEERAKRIAELSNKNKQERLLKQKQNMEELDEDLTRGTLTDEENELNDEANDTVISSHIKSDGLSTKELEKAQEFLSIKKRNMDIQPVFKSAKVFTKDKFLDAFSDDDDDDHNDHNEDDHVKHQAAKPRSSPPLSPPQTSTKDFLDSSPITSPVQEGVEESIKQMFSLKPTSNNPLEAYTRKLKEETIGKGKRNAYGNVNDDGEGEAVNEALITLDSDSDEDVGRIGRSSSPIKNSYISQYTTRAAKELNVIPELSKERKLMIRQKFSKKRMANNTTKQRLNDTASASRKQNDFLKQLCKRNIDQLRVQKLNDPEHALMEEFEKEEETMTTLLEREMERVRKIRQKEKLQERAKLALMSKALNGDKSYNEGDDESYHGSDGEVHSEVADSEVPDSEYDTDEGEEEEEGEEGEEREEGEEEGEEGEVDDDNLYSQISYDQKINPDNSNIAQDNSYVRDYGASQAGQDNAMHKLFENLPSRVTEDSFMSTQNEQLSKPTGILPEFTDLTQEHQATQSTQVDTATQIDSLSNVAETQVIRKPHEKTIKEDNMRTGKVQISMNAAREDKHMAIDADNAEEQGKEAEEGDGDDDDDDDDDEDDVITPAQVSRGRKALRKKMIEINNDIDEVGNHSNIEKEEEEEVEIDPEVMQQRVKEYEQKIRRQELQARRRRKEMERRGIKNIVEGEAEESEDEWKGLGGDDGEFSDVANSEDEKMIDNDFNIDLKNEEVRRKFMEDYQIKDQKELEKLLDDIKNHKLIRRVGHNGLDIELSDEEDQLLAAYRRQKLQEQQQRLLQNKKLQALSKDEKSKAFFATIQDKNESIKIDSDSENEVDKQEIVSNPFNNEETKNKKVHDKEKISNSENDDEKEQDSLEKVEPIRKTIKIEESFVQKQLSFLHNSIYDDEETRYQKLQKMSNFQHGLSDNDDDVADLNELKSRCSINLGHKQPQKESRKRSLDQTETDVDDDEEDTQKDQEPDSAHTAVHNYEKNYVNNRTNDDGQEEEEEEEDDDDGEFMPVFKKPSLVKSFVSFQEQQGISIKDGKQHFSGVTISKQYKVVSGSKASITYMSRNSSSNKRQNTEIKNSKQRQIEKNLNNFKRKSTSSSLFSNSGF
ncbi:hypothetical protein PVL30_000865 [Lodderomyces elongisporus]|uniref:uncharacterized protein n=1 Tax=Lodderomyces elongisporus TaxID=36914 RepID=UPI002926166D|nr:uncharacterized protein PVL30_000865 [Lodderomyces elongisporus]WLF77156.1 hypothetical protein PVL30_000865 [Lodderomyces elongisporus]